MKFLASFLLLGILSISATSSKSTNATLKWGKAAGGARVSRDDLISYLNGISGSYTISGQHNREPNSDPSKWTRTARDITGKYPGLWGGDFLFLNDDVQHRQDMINEAINQWNAGSVVALTWHFCPPTVGVTCNWDNQGILSGLNDNQWNDLITNGGDLNNKYKARLDTVVPFLRQLENAGVVALWRPIHEMNEGWSWWGGRPGANGSRKLYQLTHDYLVQYHNLNSLVWVWCVKDVNMGSIGDYWPGTNYVDVASLDMWMKQQPTDSDYQQMLSVAQGKPIALAETGSVPTPDTLNKQPRWLWFMVWAEYLKDPAFNNDDKVKTTYYLSRVKSRGDIDIGEGSVPSDNLALNHPAVASTTQGSGYEASKAVDGSLSSRWASDAGEQQWIYVNLGSARTVRTVKVAWEDAYAKGFQIQTSLTGLDGSWTNVYENYNGNGGTNTISITPTSAQFVKVYAFDKASEWGYSIFEIEVYS